MSFYYKKLYNDILLQEIIQWHFTTINYTMTFYYNKLYNDILLQEIIQWHFTTIYVASVIRVDINEIRREIKICSEMK